MVSGGGKVKRLLPIHIAVSGHDSQTALSARALTTVLKLRKAKG